MPPGHLLWPRELAGRRQLCVAQAREKRRYLASLNRDSGEKCSAAYEVFGENKSPLEVAAKTAGGMAGMWAGSEALAPIGGAVAGPPGAFIFALAGGVGGAYLGENGVDSVIKWLKE
jgi:hypothetical protein